MLALVEGEEPARGRPQAEFHLSECAECRVLASALVKANAGEQGHDLPRLSSLDLALHATLLAGQPDSLFPSASGRSQVRPRFSSHPPATPQAVMRPSGRPGSRGRIDDAELLVTPGMRILGKYTVVQLLGKGGMGFVLKATHEALLHPFAIKFLHPSVAASEARERFLREARVAVTLQGEYTVRVADVGEADVFGVPGLPYMVMEYLAGHTLAAELTEHGPMESARICSWMLDVCEALAEAHSHGVVHRDLKPENLFVVQRPDRTKFVKVLDFGISKWALEPGHMTLTSDELIMGTPRYMAPEQMQSSKNVDARADIWSLGAVMYELATGAPAFDAKTLPELAAQVQSARFTRLNVVAPNVPKSFAAIVDRCLRVDRSKRYQDVGQLAASLAELDKSRGPVARERITRLLSRTKAASVQPAKPRTRSLVAGALAVLTLGAVATLARHHAWRSVVSVIAATPERLPMPTATARQTSAVSAIAATAGSGQGLPSTYLANAPATPMGTPTATGLNAPPSATKSTAKKSPAGAAPESTGSVQSTPDDPNGLRTRW